MSTTEKKTIKYKGMELPCIESGYWPDGVTLVRGDDIDDVDITDQNIVCLHKNVAFYDDGETTLSWKYWAILPPKPAPKRLTNREVGELCKKGWDLQYRNERVFYGAAMVSALDIEDDPCDMEVRKLRAPNSDDWLEPTSDLLGVGK